MQSAGWLGRRAIECHGILWEYFPELLENNGIHIGIGGSSNRVNVLAIIVRNTFVVCARGNEAKDIGMPLEGFGAPELWEMEI